VTFSTSFQTTPTVTVTHVSTLGGFDIIASASASAINIRTLTPVGAGMDFTNVNFIAIG
jgi:hypothetical protein